MDGKTIELEAEGKALRIKDAVEEILEADRVPVREIKFVRLGTRQHEIRADYGDGRILLVTVTLTVE